MKHAFILLTILCIGFSVQAQTVSKKDAKKVSKEINDNIKKVEVVIENADWSELQNLLDKTLAVIEKNTEAIVEVVDNIDIKEVVKTMDKVATKIEDNVDVRKLEETADRIGQKVEDAMERKAKSIK